MCAFRTRSGSSIANHKIGKLSALDVPGNVIFIGDANHAVSPFSGAGSNLALMDGLDLAEQLCKASSFEEAVKAYDKLAIPRSKQVIRMSHFTISVAHSTGWWTWAYV